MQTEATFARDSGRQPERTGLSWSRTALLALIAASLSIRLSLSGTNVIHLLPALLLAALAGAMLHHGHQRSRYIESEEVVTDASRRFLLATSSVLVIASTIHIALLLARFMR
jgi:uncharacterized membrane protein YidH (DUF202 family)